MCLVKTTKIILLKGELILERMLRVHYHSYQLERKRTQSVILKNKDKTVSSSLSSYLAVCLCCWPLTSREAWEVWSSQRHRLSLSFSLPPPYSFLFCYFFFFFPPRLSHLRNRPLIREILLNCWQWCTVVLRWHDVWGKRFCCTTTQNQLENYFLRQVRNLHCFS